MDRGAHQARVHGVVKSWTQLSDYFFLYFTIGRTVPSQHIVVIIIYDLYIYILNIKICLCITHVYFKLLKVCELLYFNKSSECLTLQQTIPRGGATMVNTVIKVPASYSFYFSGRDKK